MGNEDFNYFYILAAIVYPGKFISLWKSLY